MTTHLTGTRDEWLAARLDLLAGREGADAARATSWRGSGRRCPGSASTRTYRFDTDDGSASLADLFQGRSQLLVYHFMFGPDYKAGCPSCSAIADGFNGSVVHLANHDVTLMAVSRAPLAKLQAYKQRMGWTFPWASSHGGDFNFDFNVSFTEEQQRAGGIEYNYRREPARSIGSAPACHRPSPQVRRQRRHRRGRLHARAARPERVRARGRRRLPHLLRLLARRRRHLGHVSVARPRAAGAQRARACGGGATTSIARLRAS